MDEALKTIEQIPDSELLEKISNLKPDFKPGRDTKSQQVKFVLIPYVKALDNINCADKSAQFLENYHDIFIDNLDTLTDIYTSVVKGIKSNKRNTKVLKLLSEIRPSISFEQAGKRAVNLNPQARTYLELLAQAPFSFLALKMPFTFGKNKSGSYDLLSPKTWYDITRSNKYIHGFSFSRNGGCPALNKAFADLDLINRLGRQFFRVYSLIERQTVTVTADETSDRVVKAMSVIKKKPNFTLKSIPEKVANFFN